MDGYRGDDDVASDSPRGLEALLWIAGVVALLAIGIVLEETLGISFATPERVASVCFCQFFIYKVGADYPEEQWPRISFWAALIVNVAIFFTPLTDRPASREELMLFALPDCIVVLAARTFTYSVTNVHQRAMRQQMILGLVLAIAFCAIIFTLVLIDPHTGHSWGPHWR